MLSYASKNLVMENSITLMECLEVNFIELIIIQIFSKIAFGLQKVIRLETDLYF